MDEELAFTHAKVQRLAYDVDLQYNAHYETAREERLKTVVGPCMAAGVFAVERLGALLRGRASWVPSRFTAANAIAAAAYNFYKFKEEHVEQQRRAGKALEKVCCNRRSAAGPVVASRFLHAPMHTRPEPVSISCRSGPGARIAPVFIL